MFVIDKVHLLGFAILAKGNKEVVKFEAEIFWQNFKELIILNSAIFKNFIYKCMFFIKNMASVVLIVVTIDPL